MQEVVLNWKPQVKRMPNDLLSMLDMLDIARQSRRLQRVAEHARRGGHCRIGPWGAGTQKRGHPVNRGGIRSRSHVHWWHNGLPGEDLWQAANVKAANKVATCSSRQK